MKNKKGFTLVELIIVIAVIGVLAAILIPVFADVIEKANSKSALSDARNMVSKIIVDSAEKPEMPENIVIAVKKGNSFYLYGYDRAEGGQLQVSKANKFPKGKTFEQIFNDYSWNAANAAAPDLTETYDPTQPNQVFYLVKEGDGSSIKAFHGTKGVMDDFINVADMLETKMGDTDEIYAYQGVLLPGGWVSVSSDPGTTGLEQATVAPSATSEPSVVPTAEPTPGAPEGSVVITTAEEFINIPTTGLDQDYWLANDIDFDGAEVASIGKISGSDGNPFTGTFTGNGHTLSNLTLPTASYCGLFFENQGTITGLNVSINDSTSGGSYGIIACQNSAGATISQCGVSGNIDIHSGGNYWYTGGVVAYNMGDIDQCWSNVNITAARTAQYYNGGISGYNEGVISNCFAFGTIESAKGAGITGYIDGTVEHSYSMCKLNDIDSASSNWTKHLWGEANNLTVDGFFFQKGLYYKNGINKTTWDTSTDPDGYYGSYLKTDEWLEATFTGQGWSTDIWDFSNAYPTLKNAPVPDSITVAPPVTPVY